jgi:hypothetical protein
MTLHAQHRRGKLSAFLTDPRDRSAIAIGDLDSRANWAISVERREAFIMVEAPAKVASIKRRGKPERM